MLQIAAASLCRMNKTRFMLGAMLGAKHRARRRGRGSPLFKPEDEAPEEARQLVRGWTQGLQRSQSAQVLSFAEIQHCGRRQGRGSSLLKPNMKLQQRPGSLCEAGRRACSARSLPGALLSGSWAR